MRSDVSRRMDQLKARVATVDEDGFEVTFRELQSAMNERRDVGGQARRKAFRRIHNDDDFPAKQFLSLLAIGEDERGDPAAR